MKFSKIDLKIWHSSLKKNFGDNMDLGKAQFGSLKSYKHWMGPTNAQSNHSLCRCLWFTCPTSFPTAGE